MVKGADGKDKNLMNPPASRSRAGSTVFLKIPEHGSAERGRAMVLWGHAPNSQTRMKEMKTAMEKLDMLVVVDPYPDRLGRPA